VVNLLTIVVFSLATVVGLLAIVVRDHRSAQSPRGPGAGRDLLGTYYDLKMICYWIWPVDNPHECTHYTGDKFRVNPTADATASSDACCGGSAATAVKKNLYTIKTLFTRYSGYLALSSAVTLLATVVFILATVVILLAIVVIYARSGHIPQGFETIGDLFRISF